MRALWEYVRDVVLVIVILSLLAGWMVSWWLVTGVVYVFLAVGSIFVGTVEKSDAPPPQKRRPTKHP